MEKGFIKLQRKITEWEWYDDIPTKVLWFHILLTVNWKEKKWHGEIIKPGEIITSIDHLADEVNLSSMQVRRALKNLQKTGEIKLTTTNRFTKIIVKNYKKYQNCNNQTTSHKADKQKDTDKKQKSNNNQTTNKQQTNNKQTTTTKEYKEVKEEDISLDISSKEKSKRKFTPPTVEEVIDYCKQRNNKVDAETFIDFYSSKDWMIGKNKMKDWKACVRTWERREKSSSGANGVKLLPESERDHSLDDVF